MADRLTIYLVNPDCLRLCPLLPPAEPRPPAAPRPSRPSRLGVAHHEARDWKHDPVRKGVFDRKPKDWY